MQDFSIRYPLLLGSSCSNNNLAFIVPNQTYENIILLQNVMELVIQSLHILRLVRKETITLQLFNSAFHALGVVSILRISVKNG